MADIHDISSFTLFFLPHFPGDQTQVQYSVVMINVFCAISHVLSLFSIVSVVIFCVLLLFSHIFCCQFSCLAGFFFTLFLLSFFTFSVVIIHLLLL